MFLSASVSVLRYGNANALNIGLARTIYITVYIRLFWQESPNIRKYTVIYGVYIGFWPTLNKYSSTSDPSARLSAKLVSAVLLQITVLSYANKRRLFKSEAISPVVTAMLQTHTFCVKTVKQLCQQRTQGKNMVK